MGRILLIWFLMLFGFTFCIAQDYKFSAGLRAGMANGITGKYFFSKNEAVEGLLYFRWKGIGLGGLYELHTRAFELPQLNWYYGGGAHVGIWHGDPKFRYLDEDRAYTVVGVDGIIGMEYTIKEIPFNISIDWKPSLNFIGYTGLFFDEFGISVRYIIE